MPRMTPDPTPRLPVTLLTGFLGSGKTTVLNHLVHQPEFADALVIINEFGEMALDHLLVAHSQETPVVELGSGCVCCSVRGDLVRTLRDVTWRFARAGRRQFGRVLIETTGLADPAPIVHTLLRHPQVAPHYRLDGVVTVVDLASATVTLDRHAEAVRQVAMADCLLLSKADLATPAQRAAVEARLAALNPGAPRYAVSAGEIAPAVLLDLAADMTTDTARWLNAAAYTPVAGYARRPVAAPRHDDRIRAFCCTLDTPVEARRLPHWQAALMAATGERLLRFKGLFNIAGHHGPWALHGVRHIFHPAEPLPAWPDSDQRTRLVFITEDVEEAEIVATLGELG